MGSILVKSFSMIVSLEPSIQILFGYIRYTNNIFKRVASDYFVGK